jgi:hypothetical protein
MVYFGHAMRAAWFVATMPPALICTSLLKYRQDVTNAQFGVGLGVGVASCAGVVGAVGLLFVFAFEFEFAFEFIFVFDELRLPLRPRRAGVVVGGTGPASAPGSAVVAGADTGSATAAGAAAERDLRLLATRDPAGINEQTRFDPGTLVNVSRSRDFFARIETITGAGPG